MERHTVSIPTCNNSPEMCSERNYKIVDTIACIISSQDDSTILPIVLLGTAVGTVITNLQGRFSSVMLISHLPFWSGNIQLHI